MKCSGSLTENYEQNLSEPSFKDDYGHTYIKHGTCKRCGRRFSLRKEYRNVGGGARHGGFRDLVLKLPNHPREIK